MHPNFRILHSHLLANDSPAWRQAEQLVLRKEIQRQLRDAIPALEQARREGDSLAEIIARTRVDLLVVMKSEPPQGERNLAVRGFLEAVDTATSMFGEVTPALLTRREREGMRSLSEQLAAALAGLDAARARGGLQGFMAQLGADLLYLIKVERSAGRRIPAVQGLLETAEMATALFRDAPRAVPEALATAS